MNHKKWILDSARNMRVLSVVAVLLFTLSCAVAPETKEEIRTLEGLKLSHTNVAEHLGEDEAEIIVNVLEGNTEGILKEDGLQLHYRERGTENFETNVMGMAGTAVVFHTHIPHHEPGSWVEYYIEIRGVGDEFRTFPGNAGEGVYYQLRFKGNVPRLLLILHIGTMFLGLLLYVIAAYMSWSYLKAKREYGSIEKITLYALASLFIGGFPLGFLMGYYTFGTPWTGFPVGGDVTDTKTLIVFIYWIIATGLFRAKGAKAEDEKKQRRYAKLVIWGTILTVLIYVVPHSI